MSPTYIRVMTPDSLETVDYSANSLAEAAQHEPDAGIYTVTNTYQTFKTLKLSAHLDRMEDSAQRAGVDLQLDRDRLKQTLREMIADSGFGDVRFRVTVPKATPERFIITLEPFTPLSDDFINKGVRVMTVPNSARHNAAAKTTGWMHQRKQISANMPEGIYDAILLDSENRLLEGLGANFYAITNGELRTAGADVLPGISQQIVFEVAPDVLPIKREAVTVADIPQLAEAFITSSSRAVVPVVEIDGHTLGDGTPGPLTMSIRQKYLDWVDAHLEEL